LFTLVLADMDDYLISVEGKCSVVLATKEHVEAIYPFMRKADQLEVHYLNSSPKESLLKGLAYDDLTLTALDPDGVPFAMFGAGSLIEGGYIWCLGTDGVNDNGYDFIKASRKYTKLLTEPYNVTFNYVHAENEAALKWLKFCGAEMISETQFSNQPFFQFALSYHV